ncbi:TPA: hypothetical protein VAW94_001324 [Streptococcus agalactiae]|uniref:hypothetical protein n=1 Tax=Streptococcus TaxID=1301 RepID=UPI0002BB8127|nr:MULTISPECIES: hypothetical protein [Streptococcus]MDU7685837.1 hypothetical protein [Bacillota bacterium]QBX13876.1 hypothetical protein Javan11_0042 [Streptococcus phage Javan11]QBX27776.1 hypothetical protein Javan42_0028 [Streptococcus phage Javan42]EPT84181.1 hypothetical protein SAG0087_10270 [Streptococcus agalactiae LMG 15091]EPU85076.1 hypothetical protein SAG0317_03025 [Streptococcus agalactiae GB00219]
MVVIKKRSNVIPVDFGEFQLEFAANDKNILNMEAVGKKLQEEGQRVSEIGDEKAFEALHDMVKASWVDLFDEEAYEKVYAFSEETTTDAMAYLLEAISGVVKEWTQRNNGDALKKYLGD